MEKRDDYCCILLAGGKGTRLSSVLADVPKPMAVVNKQPFIEWIIKYFHSEGINNYMVSLGHLAHIAEAYFETRESDGTIIKTITETSPMGTGGGVLFAKNHTLGHKIYIISNGDSLLLAPLHEAFECLEDETVDGIIIGRQMQDASRYGTLKTDKNGKLVSFAEKIEGAGVINGGIYLLKDSVFEKFPNQMPLSMENDVFPALIEKGINIRVLAYNAPFIDIGTPESLVDADEFIKNYIKE